MDEVKQTSTAKKSSSKKLIPLLIVVILLVAGGVTAYYLLKSDKKTPAANNSQTTTSANPKLTDQQGTDAKARYEQTKKAIAEAKGKTDQEMANLYASAAFDGAQLNDAEAKSFAQKALDLIPAAQKNDTANKPYQSYLNILTAISKGDYASAQASVDQSTAKPAQ